MLGDRDASWRLCQIWNVSAVETRARRLEQLPLRPRPCQRRLRRLARRVARLLSPCLRHFLSRLAMSSTSLASTTIMSSPIPSAFEPPPLDDVPAHHASPVVAFIIGLGIVTLASIMNAAGLNLTKLDHVGLLPNTLQPHTDLWFRLEQVLFQRLHVRRTGFDHYGSWACCFICEPGPQPSRSPWLTFHAVCPNSSAAHSHWNTCVLVCRVMLSPCLSLTMFHRIRRAIGLHIADLQLSFRKILG